jgi:endoglucanase
MKKFLLIAILIIVFAACGNGSANENGTNENGAGENVADVSENEARPANTPLPLPVNTPAPPPQPTPTPVPVAFDDDDPRSIGVVINLTAAPAPAPPTWATAADMIAEMRVGWNMGNTFDSHRRGAPQGQSIQFHETIWGNPITTRENIETLRDAGFNVLRIPVTWYPHRVQVCENHTIRADWMERIVEVVNYGMDAGMFVILNTHHDEPLINLFDDGVEESVHAIESVWAQIAYVFRDYDYRLIFEGMNEPRTIGSRAEWNGGTPEERRNLNTLNQAFVDTVRASGGNNTYRALMVPTYAASTSHQAITDFVLPNDPTENQLIVSLHMYAPYNFALTTSANARIGWTERNPEDANAIINPLNLAYSTFVQNGIPVIMGEMGAVNRDNTDSRALMTEFYVREAAARGMVCLWWDNGRFGTTLSREDGEHFGIFDRVTNTFPFPEIIDAMMRGSERE